MPSLQIKKGCITRIAEGSPLNWSRWKCLPRWLFGVKDSFCKAALKVKTGDKVKVGTPVFEDNRNLQLTF
jgi:Na+-transporting NADH:ubiquinone oxidoreductase subunit NqrA